MNTERSLLNTWYLKRLRAYEEWRSKELDIDDEWSRVRQKPPPDVNPFEWEMGDEVNAVRRHLRSDEALLQAKSAQPRAKLNTFISKQRAVAYTLAHHKKTDADRHTGHLEMVAEMNRFDESHGIELLPDGSVLWEGLGATSKALELLRSELTRAAYSTHAMTYEIEDFNTGQGLV